MAAKQSLTTKQLADLANVSARTLRYYDQIGLLVPQRDSNGYRRYSANDVAQLQRILLLRRCEVPLAAIADAVSGPGINLSDLLSSHLHELRAQQQKLSEAIAATERAVAGLEEFEAMDDQQKFETLKQDAVERFEEEYGEEARALYGDAAIDGANERMRTMSKLAWDAKEELEQRIKDELARAMAEGDPASPRARMVAEMHAQWIRVHWGEEAYSPAAHRALADGYLADPRFIAYYDEACGEGATAFLRDSIHANIQD